MTRDERDLTSTIFQITNFSADYTLSATEGTAGNIAAVLATLIRDLIKTGIINPQGTVS